MLEGEVKIRCGEEAYLVGKEDVFCLEMDRQHSYRNDTEKRISLICFFRTAIKDIERKDKIPQEAKEAFPAVLIFVEKMFYNGL